MFLCFNHANFCMIIMNSWYIHTKDNILCMCLTCVRNVWTMIHPIGVVIDEAALFDKMVLR